MENASKALIIAGAILLSILIIALGMRIYNSANSATGSSDLSAEEINAHNQTFKAYAGRQKGQQVQSLLTKIQSNNRNYTDRIIDVNFSAVTNNLGGTNLREFDPSSTITDHTATSTEIHWLRLTAAATNGQQATLQEIRSKVVDETTYAVRFEEGPTGCISMCEIHVARAND